MINIQYKRVVVNVASYDNYMLINSYLASGFLRFSMTTLLQFRCIRLKFLVRREPLFVLRICEQNGFVIIRFEIFKGILRGPKTFRESLELKQRRWLR